MKMFPTGHWFASRPTSSKDKSSALVRSQAVCGAAVYL
jgi:hypothetical protein